MTMFEYLNSSPTPGLLWVLFTITVPPALVTWATAFRHAHKALKRRQLKHREEREALLLYMKRIGSPS